MKRLLLIFFLFLNLHMFALQEVPCPNGMRYCMGECREARECARGGPPPPGLVIPIDSNISFLLVAGLGLGIFYFGYCRAKGNSQKGFH